MAQELLLTVTQLCRMFIAVDYVLLCLHCSDCVGGVHTAGVAVGRQSRRLPCRQDTVHPPAAAAHVL